MSQKNTGGRVLGLALGMAAAVAVGAVGVGVGTTVDGTDTRASITRQVAEDARDGSSGSATLSAADTAQLQALLATPGGPQRLDAALRQAFGADNAGVSANPAAGTGGVVQVLEYGVDGDHVWMKATVGDIAGGALSAACGRLGPMAPLCKVLVDVIIDWYEQNNPSHGVWGEIYRNGQVRVGSW